MCGIFGAVGVEHLGLNYKEFKNCVEHMFAEAEIRGTEAMGLAVVSKDPAGDCSIYVYKSAGRAKKIVKKQEYDDFLSKAWNAGTVSAFFGHSRLVTNGWQIDFENNQPVVSDYCVGVHNGIVVNDNQLTKEFSLENLLSNVDTEIIYRILDKLYSSFGENSDAHALSKLYEHIEGVANLVFTTKKTDAVYLSTNNGSLFWVEDQELTVFASERVILDASLRHSSLEERKWGGVAQLIPGTARRIPIGKGDAQTYSLNVEGAQSKHEPSSKLEVTPTFRHATVYSIRYSLDELKHCTKCLLPETFPNIMFGEDGECSVCKSHTHKNTFGKDALLRAVEPYRSKNGDIDCVLAFSGGRDSSYGLHYVKKDLGLNPVAYTYDWGMVTDIARRNQSRLCEKLGVEHIIRSADIPTKRRYIRKNVNAWLKNPDLGMVPLFMAGDKQFLHHGHTVRDELGLKLSIFCAGNPLERTEFKTGFCGIKEVQHGQVLWRYSIMNKLHLAMYYLWQYTKNPAYWNESVFDTLHAYYSTFIEKDNFLYLYHYIDWDEKIIGDTLKNEYGWETAGDTQTTWRIGDGTAAFYNYIYFTVAGFSEHDTFRSNQIRAGIITREEGLRLLAEDNAPRWDSMREYASLVGFNLEEAVSVIQSMPKLY